ncbi:hypothetical protein DYB28_000464 [Aphanomyces astaci]|uniref:UBA domain-containing protein n=1 Tax=Aphanomyces astaci TaxID=112090 RepID=A0A397BVA9_APHAT|nr:hypothetical protein DYB36_008737 [Aphanomyces astaci]RHY22988.1 hypothetical protein DYB25_002913 [Aphanomyces astaci]RHY39940.1 hypothetical protein DYB30_005501 [Aphanomyces astaci]RHY57663.1 hypothetical protein DYB38_007213 [Aphanomyces astaci]RHY66596.1 hypothetical protein DYB34_002100 [Aphanomyces astaci]
MKSRMSAKVLSTECSHSRTGKVHIAASSSRRMGITTIKLLHKEAQDMRRVKVSDLLHTIGKTTTSSEHAFSFDELKAYALDHAFPDLKNSDVFFYYLDDENEQVRITNEAELKEGVRLMETEGSIFKLVISGTRQVVDQDVATGIVSFDSECSMALFVDLSRLLDKWDATPEQLQMKKDMSALLHEAGVQTALIDMMADPKVSILMHCLLSQGGSILHGVAAMFAAGKVQEIAGVLMDTCPHVKDLLENIMHALQVHVHAHTNLSSSPSPEQVDTPLPPLPDDPFIVHRGLEFVTGQFFTDISSLTNDQAGEVMFNCGVSGDVLRPLRRDLRIRWIAETILKLQQVNQALKDAKQDDKEINTHGIMDADDVDKKPSAAFVGDVSFPDGSTIRAGDTFVKTWRLKNDGKTRWPAKSRLVCVGGDHLEVGDNFVSVPIVPPGKMIDVSVDMKAPTKSARYTGYWRLCTADGKRYGQRLWVDILVVGKPDLPPTPSAAASPAKPAAVGAHASNEVHLPAPSAAVLKRPVAPVSIPAPAPIVVASVVSRYQDQLDTLASMGFSDAALNLTLLEEVDGDVAAALNQLLQ